MFEIVQPLLSPKNFPETVLWAAAAVATSGVALALFHSFLLTSLFLLVGSGCFFVAYILHSTPDLSSHVQELEQRLRGLKSHLDSAREERLRLQREIRRLMTAGSEVERNVARLTLVTAELHNKEAQHRELLLRYEITVRALERVQGRLDTGVDRLHSEITRLTPL